VPLNKYTNNFTTPLETNSITGLSPTFGSDNPVLNIGAPEVNINGTELNVISRNINFSNGTVLIQSTTTTQPLQVNGGIYASGNLGIGITNPQERIHFFSPTPTNFIRLDISSATAYYGLNSFGDTEINAATNNNLIFKTFGTERGRFNSSGNLGIGTTNPTAKLDVFNGALRVGYRGGSIPGNPGNTNINSYSSIIAGVNTAFNSHFAAVGLGTTSNELAIYSFYPNFANYPTDTGPRRAADIVAGFSTFTWGDEYLAFNVGNNAVPNDGGALTLEKVRITRTGVGIGTTIPRAYLHLNSGTVSPNTAPLKFSTGTNLATIEPGAVEFDGTTLNFTPNSSIGRAAIPITVYTSGSGNSLTAGSEATNQTLFPTANDTINLPIGTYHLILNINVQRGSTSTTSAQLRVKLNGAVGGAGGTFDGIAVGVGSASGAAGVLNLTSSIISDMIITPTSITPLSGYISTVKGILKITSAGIFTPQYSLSSNLTSAGSASSPSLTNHMIIQSMATSGSVSNVGLWT
jgi:hypothetical protein